MALLATFISVNFTACSSDDDDAPANNPETTGTAEKKIVKMVEKIEDYSKTTIFNYDNNEKLIKVTIEKDGHTPYTSETWFTWGEDNIIANRTINYQGNSVQSAFTEKYKRTFTLKDGLIKECQSYDVSVYNQTKIEDMTFSYNNSKNLVNIKHDASNYEISNVWDGDKLVTIIQPYIPQKTFTYEGQCQKGYTPLVKIVDELGVNSCFYNLSTAHPEITGMRTSQLLKSLNDWSGTYNYSYEFDEEGYITKIIEGGEKFEEIDGNIVKYNDDPYIITITWQ